MVNGSNEISFIRLTESDLDLMHKWLNTDFVNEWYDRSRVSIEKVKSRYIPRINGEKPTHPYIILVDSIAIGYIQTYLIEDYPDYSICIDAGERSAGVDLFIGESDYIHKGLGKYVLRKFLAEYVFELNNTKCCIIGPEPENVVAISAYSRVGFKYFKTIHIPDEDQPEYLMRLYEEELVSL